MNSVAAQAAILETVALAASLVGGSAVGGVLALKTGGYTGDVGTDNIAGLVHGQEFVINADATKKHRALLEALNAKEFMVGGYTGDMSTSTVAGIVHGREYVVNAEGTARNRPVLEAMNSGATFGGAVLNVTVVNQSNANIAVERLSATDVRIIAREEVRREAPSIVASDIANPNSTVSKALNRNTSVQRKRS
jgi:hypothetical protein